MRQREDGLQCSYAGQKTGQLKFIGPTGGILKSGARRRNFVSCPASPETVKLYLAALSERHKVSTLTHRISASSRAHQMAGHSSPTEESPVRLVMAGMRRRLGTAAQGERPLLVPDLQAMVKGLPNNLLGLRDWALLFDRLLRKPSAGRNWSRQGGPGGDR